MKGACVGCLMRDGGGKCVLCQLKEVEEAKDDG